MNEVELSPALVAQRLVCNYDGYEDEEAVQEAAVDLAAAVATLIVLLDPADVGKIMTAAILVAGEVSSVTDE